MESRAHGLDEVLAVLSTSHPDEVKAVREHLDGLLVHPVVLAERAIRATQSAGAELARLNNRLESLEKHIEGVLEADAERRRAEAQRTSVEAEERRAALKRQQESGQWFRSSTAAAAGWLGKRSESAVALILGALAAWLASQLGVGG